MKIVKALFFVLIIFMYAYAFATGIAITHLADDIHECPICASYTNIAQN